MSDNRRGYDWLTLDSDEEVLWSGQPAPETMYGAYITGVPMILFFGLGLLVIAGAYLNRENTDYVVTSKSVYKKTGILSRSVSEVEYEKVQNTSFSVGVIGRYFDYGNVDISTAGGSGVEMTLRGVSSPQDVQKRLSRRVKEIQGGRGRDGEESKQDVLSEILTELRAIRAAVEDDDSVSEQHGGGAADWDAEQS